MRGAPVAVKMPSGGSVKRPDGAAGLERRPLAGTRCATAQRTARRRPAGWFALLVQPGGGAVLADQVWSLDWRPRRLKFAAAAPRQVVAEVLGKLRAVLS